jgi:hypothetical protein
MTSDEETRRMRQHEHRYEKPYLPMDVKHDLSESASSSPGLFALSLSGNISGQDHHSGKATN